MSEEINVDCKFCHSGVGTFPLCDDRKTSLEGSNDRQVSDTNILLDISGFNAIRLGGTSTKLC